MSEVASKDNQEFALTEQDVAFVAAKAGGMTAIDALIHVYGDERPDIQEWAQNRNSEDAKTREYAKLMLRREANNITRRRPVQVLAEHYQNRIIQMGETALDTLEELMIEGKSEKVRADVAIEVTRHNLGNPDKDQTKDLGSVVVIIGEPPKDIRNMAEVHRNKQEMGADIDYNEVIGQAQERKKQQIDAIIEGEVIQ